MARLPDVPGLYPDGLPGGGGAPARHRAVRRMLLQGGAPGSSSGSSVPSPPRPLRPPVPSLLITSSVATWLEDFAALAAMQLQSYLDPSGTSSIVVRALAQTYQLAPGSAVTATLLARVSFADGQAGAVAASLGALRADPRAAFTSDLLTAYSVQSVTAAAALTPPPLPVLLAQSPPLAFPWLGSIASPPSTPAQQQEALTKQQAAAPAAGGGSNDAVWIAVAVSVPVAAAAVVVAGACVYFRRRRARAALYGAKQLPSTSCAGAGAAPDSNPAAGPGPGVLSSSVYGHGDGTARYSPGTRPPQLQAAAICTDLQRPPPIIVPRRGPQLEGGSGRELRRCSGPGTVTGAVTSTSSRLMSPGMCLDIGALTLSPVYHQSRTYDLPGSPGQVPCMENGRAGTSSFPSSGGATCASVPAGTRGSLGHGAANTSQLTDGAARGQGHGSEADGYDAALRRRLLAEIRRSAAPARSLVPMPGPALKPEPEPLVMAMDEGTPRTLAAPPPSPALDTFMSDDHELGLGLAAALQHGPEGVDAEAGAITSITSSATSASSGLRIMLRPPAGSDRADEHADEHAAHAVAAPDHHAHARRSSVEDAAWDSTGSSPPAGACTEGTGEGEGEAARSPPSPLPGLLAKASQPLRQGLGLGLLGARDLSAPLKPLPEEEEVSFSSEAQSPASARSAASTALAQLPGVSVMDAAGHAPRPGPGTDGAARLQGRTSARNAVDALSPFARRPDSGPAALGPLGLPRRSAHTPGAARYGGLLSASSPSQVVDVDVDVDAFELAPCNEELVEAAV